MIRLSKREEIVSNSRKISVIIPAYNESGSIALLYDEIIESINVCIENGQVGDYEIWFVNDGSTDDTGRKIRDIIADDSKVHLIEFRRNFGKASALNAGFRHVNGDIVFTMDADLQDDPKEFPRFIAEIDKGYDLVVGWKKNRLDSAEKRLPSKLFNKVTSIVSGVKLHDHDCGFKCFKSEVIESLDLYGELHRYIPVLVHRKGFIITEISVNHRSREHGHSKYGMERYMRGLLDSLTTTFLLKYSDRPMYFFGRVGLFTSFIGIMICFFLTILWLMGQRIGGRPLLVLGVLLIVVGIQFISTGFVCNIVVDRNFRSTYDESHIRTII